MIKARSVDGLTVTGNNYDTAVPIESLFQLKDCTNVRLDAQGTLAH